MTELPRDEGCGNGVASGAERTKLLNLPGCEGLPREMPESVRKRRIVAAELFTASYINCLHEIADKSTQLCPDL